MTMATTPLIQKTHKLFIAGEFPRSESGRSEPIHEVRTNNLHSQVCRSSRKDLRTAVTAALAGASEWHKKSAYNRGQILYRMAEMMQGRRRDLGFQIQSLYGVSEQEAQAEIDSCLKSFIYYAGFTDKLTQVSGSLNPVSGPFHNFTSLEPIGALGFLSGHESLRLADVVQAISCALAAGNSLVVLLTGQSRGLLTELAEILKTSDLPAGVVNLLSGHLSEILEPMATHMELKGLIVQDLKPEQSHQVRRFAVDNMKRLVDFSFSPSPGLKPLLDMSEAKTVWHPVGV